MQSVKYVNQQRTRNKSDMPGESKFYGTIRQQQIVSYILWPRSIVGRQPVQFHVVVNITFVKNKNPREID